MFALQSSEQEQGWGARLRNPSWPKCVQGSAQPPRNVVPSWQRCCSVSPAVPAAQCHAGSWHTAPGTLPTTADHQSPPCTQHPKSGAPRGHTVVRLSSTRVWGDIWGSRGRAEPCPCPWQPQAEALNSPEGSHSSATQKTQRQGRCRSGRSCSRCRVCLSCQGPETEAEEESGPGFTLISVTQAGWALPQQ